MLTKEKLLKTVQELPENFSIDDFLDKIMLLQKIEIGLEQSRNGETLSTEEAKVRLQKWLK
jgi:hypothetical protein